MSQTSRFRCKDISRHTVLFHKECLELGWACIILLTQNVSLPIKLTRCDARDDVFENGNERTCTFERTQYGTRLEQNVHLGIVISAVCF